MASDLSLLFTLRAKNEASNEIKALETSISVLKARIRELKTESSSPFKTQQLGILNDLLKQTTQRHRELTKETKETAKALQQDLGGALQAISPRIAALAGSAGPIALVAAGFIATGVAAVALGQHLFELSKQTADFQGKLLDLSQQTGVSVETLSALEIAASTTGGSIESVTASLGIFQKNMEEANDSNSKAAKQFQALNVEITNTEDTLRQTLLALAKMPEGYRQTAAALELFGRGGKQVLAIIKETNGDLDTLILKLRNAGLVTTEQARQADKFNDELALLGFQLRGLGSEIIPGVTKAVQDLSKFLKENAEAVEAVKVGIGLLAAVFIHPLRGALQVAQFHIEAVTKSLERLGIIAAKPIVVEVQIKERKSSGGQLLEEVFKAGAPLGSTQSEIIEASEKAGLIKSDKKPKAAKEDPGLQLLQSLTEELARLTPRTRAQELAQELLNKKYKDLKPELERVLLSYAKLIDAKKAQNEEDEETEKAIKGQGAALTNFLQSQHEQLRQLREGIKGPLGDVIDFINTSIQSFGDLLTASEKFWLRFDALQIQAATDAKRLREDIEAIALTAGPSGLGDFLKGLAEDAAAIRETGNVLSTEQLAELGPPPELDEHIDKVGILRGAYESLAAGIASGVGTVIQNLVLLGTVGPQAFRKVLAAALATVAAQAGAQAVYELALGIAALTPWGAAIYGSPVLHFKAAALLGSIALGAGLIGRGVAGGAFSEQSAGGGSSTTPGTVSPTKPTPVDIDRNSINLRVVVERDEGSTVKAFIDNWRSNGPVRRLVQEDV